jgi:HSP20 family molecular chaperone IbpA
MSNVAVEKVREAEGATPMFERTAALAGAIRERAYEIFQGRGGGHGHSVEDWLQAERDIVQPLEVKLTRKEGKFRARVAVPGFAVEDIRVTAMPAHLYIQAEAKYAHEEKDGDVNLCKVGRKQIFHRLDLPSPIDVDRVTATLDHGLLEIIAPKAASTKNEIARIAAA